jgi:predicted lipid carrier protein YhbT
MLPPPIQTLLSPVPLLVAERVAQVSLRRMLHLHPALFDRLGEYAGRLIVFRPSDLDLEFGVNPRKRSVRAARPGGIADYDTRISGPLVLLLGLAEGRLDGDAEFFGRQITVEGDMETALALRNAVEDASLDFAADMAPRRGPLRQPVWTVLDRVRTALLAREGGAQWN